MSVRYSIKPKRSRLSAALFAAMLLPVAGSALAQEQTAEEQKPAPAANGEATNLDKVVVTGSRIKKSEIEGPSPVTVVTAEDIEKQGYSTVYDALNALTQNTASVQNELNQNGFTPNASFLNLRGLGPGYSLVLINGRRAADYPLPYNSQSNAVNLANIPAAAIERVEVLAGGASAIYGSDAVAGVVNVILKTNYEGDLFTLRTGTTSEGGGDSGRIQWVGGKAGDNWSLVYAFEALEREEIFASQRKSIDSYRDQPGIDPANARPPESILVIDAFDSNRLFGGATGEEVCSRFSEFETYYFATSAVYRGPRCGYFGYPATQVIRNSDNNLSGYIYGTWDFEGDLQGFAQLSVSRSKAKLASGTQFWASDLFFDPNLESDVLGPGGGAFVSTQRIFSPAEVGGLNAQDSNFDERTYDFAVGLRGSMFERFDWEATASRAEYKLDSTRPRFLENELNDYFLGPQLGLDPYYGAYPVYELNQDRFFNPIDAATFRSLNTILKTTAETSVTQASFVFSGDLFELPAGAVGMAAVIEGAQQKYELTPDPRTLPNYTGPEPIYNFSDTGGGGDRDRYALGVEFSVPVVDSFKVSLAGRYDKYDDITNVDGAATWQVGLEWRPTDNLLLRASHGTSFRAPDMHYIFAGESGFFTSVIDEYRCRRDGIDPASNACVSDPDYNYSVAGTRQGSADLEEEKGKSTTIGLVWDITDNMSLTADWYEIELKGAVDDINTNFLLREEASCLLGTDRNGNPVDTASASCAFFTGLVDRTGVTPLSDDEIDSYRSFPINQAFTKQNGIDLRFNYGLDTDRFGDFDFTLSWTHVLDYKVQLFPGAEIIDERDDLANQQTLNFRSRVQWNLNWERDDWSANINGQRFGSLPYAGDTDLTTPGVDYDRFGSYVLWNAGISKKITEKATIGIDVQNLLNEGPRFDRTNATYPWFWGVYSPIGREIFANFSYKFN